MARETCRNCTIGETLVVVPPSHVTGHESHTKTGAPEKVHPYNRQGYSFLREEPHHRGASGEKWYHPEGNLGGWHRDQAEATRRRELASLVRKTHGRTYWVHRNGKRVKVHEPAYLIVERRLNALVNVHEGEGITANAAKADAEWVRRTYGPSQ